ncbi:MAG: hypothetical protein HC892_20280 [Saprospiraceae bacterium]|nr:hypothetical protein [Saprospiraceae bacterium]
MTEVVTIDVSIENELTHWVQSFKQGDTLALWIETEDAYYKLLDYLEIAQKESYLVIKDYTDYQIHSPKFDTSIVYPEVIYRFVFCPTQWAEWDEDLSIEMVTPKNENMITILIDNSLTASYLADETYLLKEDKSIKLLEGDWF